MQKYIPVRYTIFKSIFLTIFRIFFWKKWCPFITPTGVIQGHLNISKCLNKITTISQWKGWPRPSPNKLPRHTIPRPIILIIFRSKKVCPIFTPHPKIGAKKIQWTFSVICQYHCGKVLQHLESHSGHNHDRPEFKS